MASFLRKFVRQSANIDKNKAFQHSKLRPSRKVGHVHEAAAISLSNSVKHDATFKYISLVIRNSSYTFSLTCALSDR